jgi:uracil-DNA glycosylase
MDTAVADERELREQRLLSVLDAHRAQWTAGRHRRALAALDAQLQTYASLAPFAAAGGVMPGRGSSSPVVVFLAMRPSAADVRAGAAFACGTGWVDALMRDVEGVLRAREYHLMYVFPWHRPHEDVGADAGAADDDDIEHRLFLPYTAERLRILAPRQLITLGTRVARYALDGFDARVHQLPTPYMGADDAHLRPCPVRIGRHAVDVVMWPHPFCTMPSVRAGRAGWQPNSAFTPDAQRRWRQCVDALRAFVQRVCVRGPPMIDAADGREKIDASATMMQSPARASSHARTRQATPSVALPVRARGQRVVSDFFVQTPTAQQRT